MSSKVYIADLVRTVIVLLGIVYFYMTFRSGDAPARAKVLWFLEAAVALAAVSVVAIGLRAVLGDTPAPVFRASRSLILSVLSSLVVTTRFIAAVFYAGAIDPSMVVRRTLVAGATASLLLFVFAAGKHYLVHLMVHGIGALFGYAFHPVG